MSSLQVKTPTPRHDALVRTSVAVAAVGAVALAVALVFAAQALVSSKTFTGTLQLPEFITKLSTKTSAIIAGSVGAGALVLFSGALFSAKKAGKTHLDELGAGHSKAKAKADAKADAKASPAPVATHPTAAPVATQQETKPAASAGATFASTAQPTRKVLIKNLSGFCQELSRLNDNKKNAVSAIAYSTRFLELRLALDEDSSMQKGQKQGWLRQLEDAVTSSGLNVPGDIQELRFSSWTLNTQ